MKDKVVVHIVGGAVTAIVPFITQWGTNAIGWKETVALSVGALVSYGLGLAHVDAAHIKATATAAQAVADKALDTDTLSVH